MILEVFTNSLGNAYLQRHLLAVDPKTRGDAVRTGSEFLQMKPATERGNLPHNIRTVDEEEELVPRVQPVTESEGFKLAQLLTKLLEQRAPSRDS